MFGGFLLVHSLYNSSQNYRCPELLSKKEAEELCAKLNGRRVFKCYSVLPIDGKKVPVEQFSLAIPIDTTLPLLMAGHLQDRARKRAKKE